MSSRSGKGGRRPSASVATMRDPIVPLDFGGWLRRVHGVFRRGIGSLAVLAAIPNVLSALYWIALDQIRPSALETQRQLEAAAQASPTGTVDSWGVLRIEVLPLLPTMVIFAVVIAVATGFCYGASYRLALRLANGQPLGIGGALRGATSRVLAFACWGGLAVIGTMVVFGLLLLPGLVTGSPWLKLIGPSLGYLLLVASAVIVVPALVGVVFIDRAGLLRSVKLVVPRVWLALGRTVAIVVVCVLYSVVITFLLKLVLSWFGEPESSSLTGAAVVHLVNAVLAIPLVVYSVAAGLVSYAELRYREDPSVNVHTLANAVAR